MNTIIATDNNENQNLCTPCGGKCCKNLPGEYWPSDFDNNWENVLLAIETERVAFDWYEDFNGTDGYYIRPKTIKSDELFDPSWGGQCINLTQTGCNLSFEHRPTGCRVLIPDMNHCYSSVTKLDAAKAWEPYHHLIDKLRYE